MWWFKSKQRIVVLARENVTNYGDSIIADCCKYLIEKVSKQLNLEVEVDLADIYIENLDYFKQLFLKYKKIVYPGGGLNSVRFNERILRIFNLLKKLKFANRKIYLNAVGILKKNPNPENEALLVEMFKLKKVTQITTRGDFEQLKKYITVKKKYNECLVFDPAMWVNEAYNICKKQSETIGIGVIRPEIFVDNGSDFTVEQVEKMYCDIIDELNKRQIPWYLFTNGYQPDLEFGLKLLDKLGINKDKILHPLNRVELVENITKFKGVIAARLHANIIATSLDIASVGLVWNDKMNCFASLINCEDRYLSSEHLSCASDIVDKLDLAIKQGYDKNAINIVKEKTLQTFENIIKD